jgi:tryptophan halogenase
MHKIVIVGGGSAGWMSAAILKKSFPSKEIIVIEDKNTPIVGVGESTLSGIKEFIHYLEIDEENFLKEVDGSYKMAIKFTDFYKKDSGSFYYPFGNPFVDNINDNFTSWMIKKHIYNIEDQNDFVKTFFPSYYLFNNNKFNKNENNEFDNFNPWTDVAYHFDAIKFSLWLKNNYCLPTGVKNEYRKIVDAKVGNDGIEYLIDEKNEKIYADLFVDCTGFQSLLISSFLKEPFESFNDILPNNSAWATKITYKDKEKELVPYTNCTAIANGWVWNIPLWSRMGSGYVFSDKYISDEDALIEFKDYLCSSKLEVTRDAKEIEELEYKKIKMKVGIHKKTFVKNVVAIGLSAGFIEPLESNGLFSVHTFLFHLVKSLQRERVTQWDKDQYNFVTYSMFKNFADFVALHYL